MSELLRFLLQLILIIGFARLIGAVVARWRQPPVIGEILAGILLGPCFFGFLAPAAFTSLFPPNSLSLLNIVSQLGLILFMFLVGLRLDAGHLQSHRGMAIGISAASIVVPFALGSGLAVLIQPRLAPPGVGTFGFAFFVGIAMSITAFPVLARILDQTGLVSTPLGSIAIACAAVDDVAAWVLLAGGSALVRPGAPSGGVATTLGLLLAYAAIVIAVRPLLAKLSATRRPLSSAILTTTVLAGMASAAATEFIGIHALFGAFFIGLVMPKDRPFVNEICSALQPVTTLLLLPVFFAYTGLRMTLPAFSPELLLDGAAILAVAVVGKGGGATAAARLSGMHWRDAASLGALLNTRGLVELVVLNVGLDLGILTPALFSVMVVMALVTTAMAAPLLDLLRLGTTRSAVPDPALNP